MKITSPNVTPLLQTGIRSAGAALLVYALLMWRNRHWRITLTAFAPGMLSGVLFAAEFACVALALAHTSVSHVVVFLYAAPILTVLGLNWGVAGERLGRWQWAGILAAFLGLAVALSEGFGTPAKGMERALLGDALALLGSVFWALTTIVIRRSSLSEAPATTTLLYQLGAGGAILLLGAWSQGDMASTAMNGPAWLSLLFQTVVVAFASYLAWFWLLRHYLTSRLSAFSFLTPLFGVAFGMLLLGERMSLPFAAGALLVLAGILLVNLRRT